MLSNEANLRFLEVAAWSVACTLQLLEKAEGGPLRRAVRRIAGAVPKVRGLAAAAIAALLAAGLWIPVPYDVGLPCELQPDLRRFVAAPHDGEFQKSLVKPGDIVAQGQVLRGWKAVRCVGNWRESWRSRNARRSRATSTWPPARRPRRKSTRLEFQRQEVKRQLLQRRLANLEIKSPVDGIVVAGDLQRSEGVPVSVGQVLYEVAPLGRMTAEAAIGDEEISAVSAGMSVTLRLDSQPERQWRAVRSHASIRDR